MCVVMITINGGMIRLAPLVYCCTSAKKLRFLLHVIYDDVIKTPVMTIA